MVRMVETYSSDIGMEFGMDKCKVLVVNDGKQVRSDGVELPSGEVTKGVDENGCKYLGGGKWEIKHRRARHGMQDLSRPRAESER